MGINFSHPTVFEEPLRIRYRANSFGARICELIGLLVVLIIPFIICLAMNNFWVQYNVVTERPQLVFTDRCLLKYSTTSGREKLWGCSDALENELIGDDRYVTPFMSVYADDHDGDNRTDHFTFLFQLPLENANDGLVSFEFLPEFDCTIWNYAVHLHLLSAPYVTLRDSGADASRVIGLKGDLSYHETELIQATQYVRYDRVYTTSLFDGITDVASASNVGVLAADYANQNQSFAFDKTAVIFGDLSLLPSMGKKSGVLDLDAADVVTVVLSMRVTEAQVAYRPGYGEIIKWAWVQYFCVAYVVHWLMTWVRWLFVKQALINTIAVWEGKGSH